MSNAPDEKRPQSDVADQLAGTPAADDSAAETADAMTDAAAPVDADPLAESDPIASPAPLADPAPLVEPTPAPTSSTTTTGPVGAVSFSAEPAPEQTQKATSEPAGTDAAEAAPLPAGLATPPAAETASLPPVPSVQPQTVYVTAPTAPRKKGNRGIGTLLAVLGTIAFALLHSMITAIAYVSAGRSFNLTGFVTSTGFIVPTLVFLVVFVLAVLLINRAGWWAWVLGSLVVAVATYLLSIGIIMLLQNVVAMTPAEAQGTWERLAVSVQMIVALVVAREVAVWFGAAIASRGRRVKARNVEARATYERELAENRARYGAV